MNKEFLKITGKEDGPTSIILAGVHGNEKCGIDALKVILSDIKIERGLVLFGYGNPRAIKENKRFIDTNLNRMFREDNLISKKDKQSYEYKRAQLLKKYLNQADVLLDLHASNTPNSKSFVICEENAKKIVQYLPFNIVVSGFDKIEPGGTDYYMNSIDKIGICIECGFLGDSRSSQVAERSILNFLTAIGHIKSNLEVQKQSYIKIYDLYLTKTNNFILSKSFGDFEEIEKGQIIGIDGTENIYSKKKSVILFARNKNQKNSEAFLLGEKFNILE